MDRVLSFSRKVLLSSLGRLERSELLRLACCDFKVSVGSRPSVSINVLSSLTR